jgi:peptidyl-prolyl cis-trans isomerase SurA
MRFALAIWVGFVASAAQAGIVDRVVAVVNEEVITLSEVYELGDQFIQQRCGRNVVGSLTTCLHEAEAEILDSLITRALVKQSLTEAGMSVTPEEVDRTINRIMRDEDIADRAAFREAISGQGWEWEGYKKELSQQIRQMKFNQSFINPRVNISEDEIRNVYKRTQRQFASQPKRQLEALSVQMDPDISEADTQALLAKLSAVSVAVNTGKLDWVAAIEANDSGVYKQRKGQMGAFQESELINELKSVFALKINDVSAPLVVANSVMLIKVVGENAGDVKPFEDVRDQIYESLFQAKLAEEMAQWVTAERRQASVRVLLDMTTP